VASKYYYGTSLRLTWKAPATNGGSSVTGYKVYRHSSTGSYALVKTLGVATAWRDTTTATKQTYWYEVTAVNAVGESAPSNEATQTAR
jgi:fibronectin type 3 domain-containing protein